MQHTRWDHHLKVTGDGQGLAGHAGAVLLRKLADQSGLTAALGPALARAGKSPLIDRGMALVSMAIAIALGATSLSDIAVLAHLEPVLGTAPSDTTARRTLELADPRTLGKVAKARARVRAHAWELIGERPGGFPWLEIAGKALTGWLVIDMDATLVTAHSPALGTRSLSGGSPASWSDALFRRVAVFKVTHSSVRWRLNSQSRKKVTVAGDGLRLVLGGAAVTAPAGLPADPVAFQDGCLLAFEASQVARGFSQTSMDNGSGVLERFLAACGRPAWDVTREDVDRVVAGLSAQGLAASTRRGYVQAFKGFHAFLVARKAGEIEAAFGVRLVCPVDEFNAARHVGSDSPSVNPPPGPERMEEFFDFLKERIAGARKYAVAGRDYALYRTLYLAGVRAEESASMDRADVHFGRGPFGKLHVRFGKGALTSGPRPRWVPMLDGLDLILRWYLEEIRPRLGDGPALFCDEGGGRIHRGTVRNRLACLLGLEQAAAGTDRGGGGGPARVRFSPHSLRHACATRNYERGVDLVAIQQMLGHWHVGTTMRYVTPSATFIEDAYRRAVSGTLAGLEGDGDAG